jgi:hypothetical protein
MISLPAILGSHSIRKQARSFHLHLKQSVKLDIKLLLSNLRQDAHDKEANACVSRQQQGKPKLPRAHVRPKE